MESKNLKDSFRITSIKIATTTIKSLATAVMLFVATSGNSKSAVLITTTGSAAAGDYSMQVPTVEFVATSDFAGGVLLLVIQGAHLVSPTQTTFIELTSSSTLAGGSIGNLADGGYAGGAITANDAYFYTFNGSAFTNGDTVILAEGNLTQINSSSSTFVDITTGEYEIFLMTTGDQQLSSFGTAIPEPSAIILCTLGGLGLLTRRRKA